uniref:Uncharacterized protein n=1 Tax=Rhizophora mucronata TaxID=61149 RepID=A0A2P2NHT1_RHIMU
MKHGATKVLYIFILAKHITWACIMDFIS